MLRLTTSAGGIDGEVGERVGELLPAGCRLRVGGSWSEGVFQWFGGAAPSPVVGGVVVDGDVADEGGEAALEVGAGRRSRGLCR